MVVALIWDTGPLRLPLFYNYLSSLSFLLASVFLHLFLCSVLSSHNLWALRSNSTKPVKVFDPAYSRLLTSGTLEQTREGVVEGGQADKSGSAQGRGGARREGSRGMVVDSDPRTGATAPREDFLQRAAVPHNSCREEEWVRLREWITSALLGVFMGHLFSTKCLSGCVGQRDVAGTDGLVWCIVLSVRSKRLQEGQTSHTHHMYMSAVVSPTLLLSLCLLSEAEGWDSRGDQWDWKPGPDWREVKYLSTAFSMLERGQLWSTQPLI